MTRFVYVTYSALLKKLKTIHWRKKEMLDRNLKWCKNQYIVPTCMKLTIIIKLIIFKYIKVYV